MDDKVILGVGLAKKLQEALNRNGIGDTADLDWLASGENVARVHQVRLGHAEIVIPEHSIDLDADPFVPHDWAVLPDDEQLQNRVRGMLKWNAANVALHLDKDQKNGKRIEGNKLRKELAKKPVFNANLLDYLLANPHLIPEEWKGKFIFFWGTIYRGRDGRLYVRCLGWDGVRWDWGFLWLDDGWDDDNPAVVDES